VGIAVRPVLQDPPVEIVDELSATVKLTRPLPYFTSYLTTQLGMVASPTWLAAAQQDPALNQRPVGVGPFMYESRQLNTRTKLVRNPDYWREGLPYLDSLTFVVATDAQARAQNLKAGDLDVMHTTRDEDILQFRDDSDVTLFEDNEGEETFVMMNVSKPPFDDVRARQALAHATDRDTIVQLLGSGILEVANSMFFPGSTYDTGVDNFPEYDPAEAQRLAGEYCADVPASCDGSRITFEYKTTPSPENEEVYQTLAEMWGDVASMSRVPVEQAQYIQDVALGSYNAVLWRQFGAVNPDSDMLWLDSESIGVISLNFARNADPDIDQWLDEQRVSLDLEERIDLWDRISRRLNEDLPFIWLNHTLWGIAAQPDVHGLEALTFPDDDTTVRPFSNGRFELCALWRSD
jgi:ABC-type transport system substrate-binding protein